MGPEIVIALQAMRGAWSGIQFCCECLRDGTAEVQRVKKTIEGGVKDAKQLYTEVTGLWGWLKSLFGKPSPKPAASATVTTAEPVAKKKAKDEYVEHIPSEDEIVQRFIEHLGNWFDNYGTLKAFAEKRYAEVFGKDVINQKDVLELTQLQAELDAAYPTLSDLMTNKAPWQLGPIWTKFKEMQDKVAAGQAARQMAERRAKANREAKAAQERSDRIDTNMTWFWSIMLVLYFWTFIGEVWLNATTTR